MDHRPIGFFDSGLGGLTCIPHLLRALPSERIIYFGDTARTPYGSKDPSTIRRFAAEIADFLVESQDVKMIAIACNTVSATALDELRQRHPKIPILSIISPASHEISKTCTPENRIGVIGTRATIASEAYPKKIHSYNPGLSVRQQACPALVPLIEEGIIQNDIMDLTIRYYLDPFIEQNKIDTLVLGCTHYPFVRENIASLYPDLHIVDPSEEMFQSISDALGAHDLYAADKDDKTKGGEKSAGHIFYASDLSENYINMINRIFSRTDYPVTFRVFDLEYYLEQKRGMS